MRAALQTGGFNDQDIFFAPVQELIREFFDNENTYPASKAILERCQGKYFSSCGWEKAIV
ncbi:MAG UNVERIFIED_CONTAM: hypothetical protein LVR29_09015 [Microcystis novacekii LVE1205-3]|jgi:hypothetical protein